jgi:hypothetical protein
MCGAIPPLHNMLSWHGAQFKKVQGHLYLYKLSVGNVIHKIKIMQAEVFPLPHCLPNSMYISTFLMLVSIERIVLLDFIHRLVSQKIEE